MQSIDDDIPKKSEEEIKMMEEYYSTLVSAKQSGATKLPSSDIPLNNIDCDPNTIPSHIPDSQHNVNYIPQEPQIIYRDVPKKSGLLDFLLTYLQTPLLIGLCYFIFQMPFIKTSIVAMLPGFYIQEGSLNLYGIILTSILFSLFFTFTEKTVKGLQEMD
uniref:Uncharacterized protein n=1 Tax=viral metagenome TaxID=1070528 RepID=A0A6C0H662_9ZZZZ